MCGHCVFITYMLERNVWLKHFMNTEVYLVGYFYILHLINTRNLKRTNIVKSKLECWFLFLARQF
jgi:hypothetical protein